MASNRLSASSTRVASFTIIEGVGLRSPAVPAQGLILTDLQPDVRHNAPYPTSFQWQSETANLRGVTPRSLNLTRRSEDTR